VQIIEDVIFRWRAAILIFMAAMTVIGGYFAVAGWRMEAGFLKQVPLEHPYVQTYFEYQKELPGANLVVIGLRSKTGDMWNVDFFKKLYAITEEARYLPGVDRARMFSLWTPNTQILEITEEGFDLHDVVPGDVTVDSITQDDVDAIRQRVLNSDLYGDLVALDETASIVLLQLREQGAGDGDISSTANLALEVADILEQKIRAPFTDDKTDVMIIGFPKFIGDIAEGAIIAAYFFGVAFVLTGLAVYFYVRSLTLSALAIGSSLVSVVWQFGVLGAIGYALDPLAILVPFLVYAIGVSHGMQQVNLIATQIAKGQDGMHAARATFRRLLVPGSMALITDLVGFVTLYLIPVGVVQDIAVIATIGVALKIISNLVMLPLIASYIPRDDRQVRLFIKARARREQVMSFIARIAQPQPALYATILIFVLLGLSYSISRDRHVGDITAGASELRPDSKYNQDTAYIATALSVPTDVLIIILETPRDACIDPDIMNYVDRFSLYMRGVPGVVSVDSLPFAARSFQSIGAEGSLKWRELPPTTQQLISATSAVPTTTGLLNNACTILPVIAYMSDHKATTINEVVAAVEAYDEINPNEDVTIRLGMGGVGIIAATNEVIEESEAPLILYVFATIIVLVFLAYVDWRAVICCCMPLLLATFLGYVFMVALGIGLKVTTLPVLVLGTGIGVDYAFYLYSQIRYYQKEGLGITDAYEGALLSTGMAVVYTAIMLAIGVGTWVLSPLKFQADMGALLAFMFLMNMVAAILGLPAFATTLERIAPRRKTPDFT
jgi:predicted RND superfamily exporter protein